MAWRVVSNVVGTISELLAPEAIPLWGVEDQVHRLQRELKWMQRFLKDADARRGESECVRLWVDEISDLAYDAQVVVEAFAMRSISKRKRVFPNVINRSACILREAAKLYETRSKIDIIMARITDLTGQLQRYGIQELRDGEESSSSNELRDGEGSSSSNGKQELRRSYPHFIEDNIVGFSDKIEELVSIVIDEENHYRVVSIWGMDGSGKTTLARKVYHHRQVRGHFHHLAWVSVPRQCQRRNVWEGILSSFNMMSMEDKKKKDEELAEKLFNFLKDKKCLVILDDMFIRHWESLEAAFPMRDTTSKILITVSHKSAASDIASHVDGTSYLYELQCLTDEESWELFRKIVFPHKHSPDYRVDRRMVDLGKKMVKHCAGLPLAIIVLGGILASKSSLQEWQTVFDNVEPNLGREGTEVEGADVVLTSGFDDLPPHLIPSVLYLSNFPEDYDIDE